MAIPLFPEKCIWQATELSVSTVFAPPIQSASTCVCGVQCLHSGSIAHLQWGCMVLVKNYGTGLRHSRYALDLVCAMQFVSWFAQYAWNENQHKETKQIQGSMKFWKFSASLPSIRVSLGRGRCKKGYGH